MPYSINIEGSGKRKEAAAISSLRKNKFDNLEFERLLKSIYIDFKGRPSKRNAESLIRLLTKNVYNLVKKDIDSNTFFILPYAESLIALLEKNRSQEIKAKLAGFKQKVFDYINFQNILFKEEIAKASFYFLKKKHALIS